MQPPPRKGSSAKFLKTLHAEQINKLQVKNQTECELLEDLRAYIIKKSSIEKQFSEALLKMTSNHLNKKITATIPDLKTEGSEERWNMWSVWRTVLEENEKLARARLAAIEIFQQQIADDAKILRLFKLQTTKKCTDLLANIQKELQSTVHEVDRTKKSYFDEEHCAHDVRDKARDIEQRLKRKKGSIFQSLSTLQKSSAKASQKRELMDDKSAGARNDYILSLAAANAHQTRYFVIDLQTTMQAMESNVYEKVQEYISLLAKAELLTTYAQQSSYTKIRDQAQQLTREYNLQCLYLYYPVLKQHIQYEFEPCDGDTIDTITIGYGSTNLEVMMDEAKKWLYTISREKRRLEENNNKLRSLIVLKEAGQRVDPRDPNGPDIDLKIEDIKEAIRKSELMKVKLEAKIETLKGGDEMIKEMVEKLEKENKEREMECAPGTKDDDMAIDQQAQESYSSQETDEISEDEEAEQIQKDVPSVNVSQDDYEIQRFQEYTKSEDLFKQLEASWDDATEETNISEIVSESPIPENEQSFKCHALYNYTAQNPDELSFLANDELEVLGEGDGDGWLRAKNSFGEEGLVPCTYLDYGYPTPLDALEGESTCHLTSQISFSSVDYTVTADDVDMEPGDLSSERSASLVTIQELTEKPSTLELAGEATNSKKTETRNEASSSYCIALYDYMATGDDELSFEAGQVIRILRTIVHDDVDDGWWEGEINGVIGLFPSLVVEPCTETGDTLSPADDFDIEPMSAPPLFTPPEVPPHLLPSDEDLNFSIEQVQDALSSFPFDEMNKRRESEGAKVPEIVCPSINVPDVCIEPESDEKENEASVTEGGADDGYSLGVTQIVITAPTPSSDSGEKSFFPAAEPPPPAPTSPVDDSHISIAIMERRKSAGEINEADPPLYDPCELNLDYPSTIIEEPEEEYEEEEENLKQERSYSISSGSRWAHTTAPSEISSSFVAIGNPDQQSYVPDQLEAHQLERLQDLKESNA